jgi:hypothetical protein
MLTGIAVAVQRALAAVGREPLAALVLFVVSLGCIWGILASRFLVEQVLESIKGQGRLGDYAFDLATWGTGSAEVAVWSYRIIFFITATAVVFVLVVWATH